MNPWTKPEWKHAPGARRTQSHCILSHSCTLYLHMYLYMLLAYGLFIVMFTTP